MASDIDWSLTTWDGARREQLRRWSQMPLAEMLLALEVLQMRQSRRLDFARRLDRGAFTEVAVEVLLTRRQRVALLWHVGVPANPVCCLASDRC